MQFDADCTRDLTRPERNPRSSVRQFLSMEIKKTFATNLRRYRNERDISRCPVTVGRPGEGLAIDCQITAEFRAFEIRAGAGGDLVNVEFYARVLNDRNGVVRTIS